MDGNTGQTSAVNTFGASGLLSRRTGTSSVFYQFDPQGSVTQRLDGSGNVLSTSVYDAYGARLVGPNTEPWGYAEQAGYFTDVETGLLLLSHRYYDPAAGPLVTRDPIGYGGGIKLCAYVGRSLCDCTR